MASKFLLVAHSGGQYSFVLKAANGETILTSERYATKAGAINGIESVKANSSIDARYDRKSTINGLPMFNLKAANGEVIGASESYSSISAREGGISSVKANGPVSPLDDQTT